jgi:uncharacterized protein
VKTRLVAALGPQGAADLQRSLVERVLRAASEVKGARLELWCSPATTHPFFSQCQARFDALLCTQRGANLGERMANALEASLQTVSRAVVVGADIPALGADYLRRALAALEHAPAVLGPAEDGGYVLIGLKAPAPSLFTGIEWGSDSVLAETRRRLRALHIGWSELETLWDLDRPADLARWRP